MLGYHHARVHFDAAISGEDRTVAGIEQGIIFEHDHRRNHSVERTATLAQDYGSTGDGFE